MNKLSYLNVINDYNDDDYGQRSGIGDWDQSDFLFENEQQKTYFKEDEVKSRLHETAYLNPSLTIEYEDRRENPFIIKKIY